MATNFDHQYRIITRTTTSGSSIPVQTACTLRKAVRHAKFIEKYVPFFKSVCVVNTAGKVGYYEVAGQPEKHEERGARQMK